MNARTQCVFLGAGPALSCVSRACFAGALLDGGLGPSAWFMPGGHVVLHVFCDRASQSESE